MISNINNPDGTVPRNNSIERDSKLSSTQRSGSDDFASLLAGLMRTENKNPSEAQHPREVRTTNSSKRKAGQVHGNKKNIDKWVSGKNLLLKAQIAHGALKGLVKIQEGRAGKSKRRERLWVKTRGLKRLSFVSPKAKGALVSVPKERVQRGSGKKRLSSLARKDVGDTVNLKYKRELEHRGYQGPKVPARIMHAPGPDALKKWWASYLEGSRIKGQRRNAQKKVANVTEGDIQNLEPSMKKGRYIATSRMPIPSADGLGKVHRYIHDLGTEKNEPRVRIPKRIAQRRSRVFLGSERREIERSTSSMKKRDFQSDKTVKLKTERNAGTAITRYESTVKNMEIKSHYQNIKIADANFDEIIKQFTLLINKGGGEAKLVLKPEHLGSLRMKIRLDQNEVTTSIIVDNQAIRDLILSRVTILEESLLKHGFNLGSFEVGVRSDGMGQDTASKETKGKQGIVHGEAMVESQEREAVEHQVLPWISTLVNITV